MQPRLPNQEPEHVVLRPTDPNAYVREASSKEPQYVTSISPVSAKVYTSSFDAERNADTSYIIHPSQNLGTGFRRVRLVSADLVWSSFNVNPVNNVIKFIYPTTADDRIVTIAPGNYSTVAELVTQINTAIAAAAGGQFAGTVAAAFPTASGSYISFATVPATLFYVETNCSFYTGGSPMFGITPRLATAQTGHVVGPITFTYTQWVDVVSSELTKNQKMRTISTNDVSNILCRIPIGKPTPGDRIRYLPETYLACARNSTDPLYQFDLAFIDQFGEPLRTASLNGELSAFAWNLTIELEL